MSEVAFEGDAFEIVRLGIEGETLVQFSGLELHYSPTGDLELAVVRLTEFARSFGAEVYDSLSAAFWETIYFLGAGEVEVLAEVDLLRREVVLAQTGRRGRDILTAYDLVHYSGGVMPLEVGSEGSVAGTLGFLAELATARNRLILGVSDLQNAVWVSRPLRVNMTHLNGEVTLESLSSFLTGKP